MKEKIIQKAAELFINLGFKSVTMDDIAHEMGISKKTIYTHFRNKTELVHETTMGIFQTVTLGIDCICELNKNPIEELYEIKRFVMLQLKSEKSSPQFQLQKYYPNIHESLKEMHFDKMRECTMRNLQRGVELGLYRKNIDIEFISRIYFVGVSGTKDQNLFPSDKFNRVRLMENFLEYHLRGIITKEGQKTLNKFIKQTIENE